jgi:4-aminobutyrate aminotransferase-like enzyme
VPDPNLTNRPSDEHLIRYGMAFAPQLIAKARGTLIWDTEGHELLDFTSGGAPAAAIEGDRARPAPHGPL